MINISKILGKTTLADNLGRQIGELIDDHSQVAVHHESVDTNDILPLFYQVYLNT